MYVHVPRKLESVMQSWNPDQQTNLKSVHRGTQSRDAYVICANWESTHLQTCMHAQQ